MGFSELQLLPGPSTLRPTWETTSGAKSTAIITIYDEKNPDHVLDLTPYDTVSVPSALNGEASEPCITRGLPITKGILFQVNEFYGQSITPVRKEVVPYNNDPAAGQVEVELDPCDLTDPGIFVAELLMIVDGAIDRRYPFYVEAANTLAWTQWQQNNPVSIAEIRLWARDNSPEDNYALDEVEYKDSEIIAALRRAVDIWNEEQPVLQNHSLTPFNFPFRDWWIRVTIALLQIMAARNLLRNERLYNAGGLTVNDSARWKPYIEMGNKTVEEYRNFVKTKKMQLNAGQAWGRTGRVYLP